MLPCIAGFVGADTVGCLLAAGWSRRQPLTLMIDIGTNGEMVLGNCHRAIACSTAAGPAFEGAKIRCGMRGADGAIDHVFHRDGVVSYSVVGGGPARGRRRRSPPAARSGSSPPPGGAVAPARSGARPQGPGRPGEGHRASPAAGGSPPAPAPACYRRRRQTAPAMWRSAPAPWLTPAPPAGGRCPPR